MPIIFKAKTHSGYTFKILAELLQNNIKTACFEIDDSGIGLTMMDNPRAILIDLFLESENFTLYKFKPKTKLHIGINLNHLHKMLKTVKKKDSLQLFIDDDNMTDLGIKVIPKENNRITTSYIKIQTIQSIKIEIPGGYGKPVIVPSSDFMKMIKEISQIGTSINVLAKDFHIKFRCNAGGVMKREVEFGEIGDSDDEDEENDKNKSPEYNQDFDIEQLSRITKIAGLNVNMQIYPKNGKPILFRSAVGTLGKVSIYSKSKDLLEKDNKVIDSDDEEDKDKSNGKGKDEEEDESDED